MNKERLEEAAELLTDLLKKVDATSELKRTANDALKEIKYNLEVKRYNQAVTFINAGNYNGATKVLQQIITANLDHNLKEKATTLLNKIRLYTHKKLSAGVIQAESIQSAWDEAWE